MTVSKRCRLAATTPVVLLTLSMSVGLGAAPRAWASSSDPSDATDEPDTVTGQSQDREPDFRFGPPAGWVGVRVSKLFASADGELFDLVRDELTIDQRDFDTPEISLEIGIPAAPRVDFTLDAGFSRASINSEFRNTVDQFDLPITQTTRLTEVPLGGSIRFLVLPRGREIGRFAWVASDFTPYVGAGVGGLWYRFEQQGDFVDFVDDIVFEDRFESSGWGLSSHVFGGASIKINRWLALAMEARYLWSTVQLGRDFVGFDDLNLAGFKITTGLNFTF